MVRLHTLNVNALGSPHDTQVWFGKGITVLLSKPNSRPQQERSIPLYDRAPRQVCQL